MFAIELILSPLTGSFFPRVEDPWPDRIGLDFPFVLSGAFGILAGLLFLDSPTAQRDRAIRWGGLGGFLAGALLYALSLAVQVGST